MNNPRFRPPAEAYSLILQVDQGCAHNRCTFCGMYRVNVYANGGSIAKKSTDELTRLRELKLQTLYMGLESGDEEILRRCRKGDTTETMVEAGIKAQQCGLRMSVMILLGLGGREHSQDHALHTANALNRMQPRLLSALRVIPVKGTELYEDTANESFRMLTEFEAVQELRSIVAGLELTSTVFRSNHNSNVVPMEGRFPKDKQQMLIALDQLLASNQLDRQSPGTMPLWL